MGFPERLKKARTALGYTLGAVATATGIGESTLSEFENGKREPRIPQLKVLADTYQRPWSFFLEEGEDCPEVVLWRQKPESSQALKLELELVTLGTQYHNLETWCDQNHPLQIPFANGNPERFHYAEAEALALRVRNDLGLGDRPGQILLRVLEEVCKVKVFHKDFEPAGSAACTLSGSFGAAILLNSRNTRWRRNFDLAHELFHLLTWKMYRSNAPENVVEASETEEKLATCFARNLLMPMEILRITVDRHLADSGKIQVDSLFEIARQFDVSVEAMLWQIGFLYNISRENSQRNIELCRDGMGFLEKRDQEKPPERPARFCALALQALRRGLMAAGKYAEYLGVSRREAMQVVEQDTQENAEVEIAHS